MKNKYLPQIKDLRRAHEVIGEFILIQNQKHELICEMYDSLVNILAVCKSPTLTTHGMNHIEKATALVQRLEKEYKY